ncbi:MAG: hypothetical protein ACMXX6_01385 [Candidatus Woesearchaeota archaeon]
MTTLVLYYDEFLFYDFNTAKDFALSISKKQNLIVKSVPVTYFKSDYLKHIKKHKPKKIFMLGMDDARKNAHIETRANNKLITLKNPFLRFLLNIYVYVLKLFGKNLKMKKSPKKDLLTLKKIEENKPDYKYLKHSLNLKTIKKSNNAHHFACNFAIYQIQKYLDENNLDTKFYFIHIPLNGLSKKQQNELKKHILNS